MPETRDVSLQLYWLRPGQKVFLPPRRQYTHWKRDGLEQEVAQILPYVSFASDTSAENRISAINAVFSGLYKDTLWVSFVEYNRNYHPELLTDAELVEVIPLCCNRLGQITADRLYYDQYSQTIPCPYCGRFSPFRWPEDVGEKGGNDGQDEQNA